MKHFTLITRTLTPSVNICFSLRNFMFITAVHQIVSFPFWCAQLLCVLLPPHTRIKFLDFPLSIFIGSSSLIFCWSIVINKLFWDAGNNTLNWSYWTQFIHGMNFSFVLRGIFLLIRGRMNPLTANYTKSDNIFLRMKKLHDIMISTG